MSRKLAIFLFSCVIILLNNQCIHSFIFNFIRTKQQSSPQSTIYHSNYNNVINIINSGKSNLKTYKSPYKLKSLYMGEIMDMGFGEEEEGDETGSIKNLASNLTDLELGKTHGYEGDYKIGEKVKVKDEIRLWQVKEYSKDGFICKGFEGTVVGYALYGRKYKSLCTAITPIKVEFEPDGKGVTAGMFSKKFIGHFAHNELERVT